MTLTALVALMVELAGPDCRAPCQRRAAKLAPVLLAEAGEMSSLGAGVSFHESSYRQHAVSHKGAIGVMGIHPGPTADAAVYCRDLDVTTMLGNVRCGVRLLRRAMTKCGPDPAIFLSRYRGERCGKSDYARNVLDRLPKV